MTIHRDGREQYLECEECPETSDPGQNFEEMIGAAKSKGWKIILAGGEWLHTCPDCKSGDRLAAARAKFGL